SDGAKINAKTLDEEQLAAHALSFLASEYEAAKQLQAWLAAVKASGEGGEYEEAIAETYVAELVRALRGGVDLGQTELIALTEMGIDDATIADTIGAPDVAKWAAETTSGARYLQIARFARDKGG